MNLRELRFLLLPCNLVYVVIGVITAGALIVGLVSRLS